MTVTVGVSLKMHFGHRQATAWLRTARAGAPGGRVVLASEPVWAIGAA